MTTLVLGASGATGKHLVEQLLLMGQDVKVIVRPTANIPDTWNGNEKVTIIKAGVSAMTVDEMATHTADCQAIAFCLGHNMTFRGILGKPRKLVADAVRLVYSAVERNRPDSIVKFVLMNTSGCRNKDLNEPATLGEKLIISIIRTLVPPQMDNEAAAEFLRLHIGQKRPDIQWVAIRPDTLINECHVTDYKLHISPKTSALLKPGKTSRINVGNFMARLITENSLWEEWKGAMPVIYNSYLQRKPNR